jgi:hypothetical protein
MQRLARDMTKMAELWEEVTRAQVATVMAGAHAAHAEGMVWVSYPVFMPKASTHRMYAQDQLFYTFG